MYPFLYPSSISSDFGYLGNSVLLLEKPREDVRNLILYRYIQRSLSYIRIRSFRVYALRSISASKLSKSSERSMKNRIDQSSRRRLLSFGRRFGSLTSSRTATASYVICAKLICSVVVAAPL